MIDRPVQGRHAVDLGLVDIDVTFDQGADDCVIALLGRVGQRDSIAWLSSVRARAPSRREPTATSVGPGTSRCRSAASTPSTPARLSHLPRPILGEKGTSRGSPVRQKSRAVATPKSAQTTHQPYPGYPRTRRVEHPPCRAGSGAGWPVASALQIECVARPASCPQPRRRPGSAG